MTMQQTSSIKIVFGLAALASPFAADAAAGGVAAAGLALGPVTFGAPWVLLGLGALPLLWWLMRTVPPKPKTHVFPAISLLFNLKSQEQEPVRMPLWHRILRLAVAGLAILGLAQPRLSPHEPLPGTGPVVLVVDNGWASARNWKARTEQMNATIDRAQDEGRPVVVLLTAPPPDSVKIHLDGPMEAAKAREIVKGLEPQPWPVDRAAALNAMDSLELEGGASVLWLSNGLDDAGAQALAQKLQSLGTLSVLQDSGESAARLLAPGDSDNGTLGVTIRRAEGAKEDILTLIASDESGRALRQIEVRLKAGEMETKAAFEMPSEVRNKLARITIKGENSAGATLLLDERWRRRPVGLVNANAVNVVQPLLSESNYVDRALSPYADLRRGSVDDVLKQELSVMVVTDSVMIDEAARRKIDEWVKGGGTLLRFAGPRLAAAQGSANDNLLPVPLYPGERTLSGGMSGGKPGQVAPFDQSSPFYGLKLREDVNIEREVMAQPSVDLDEHTWARLEDGTPLVTARREGKGWIVLVHTSANADWSNLPLSGLFVDMLRAIVAHSQGVVAGANGVSAPLPPFKVLDGRGQLGAPSSATQPLTKETVEAGRIGPDHPPGFYGTEDARQAHNLASGVRDLKAFPPLSDGVTRKTYEAAGGRTDLSGPMLAAALSLALIDLLILLRQNGALPKIKRRPAEGVKAAP